VKFGRKENKTSVKQITTNTEFNEGIIFVIELVENKIIFLIFK
jgi:hypothetical protein